MADLFAAKDASGATVEILTDEVTDATLGTGQKQIVGIMDATVNSTNKLIVDSSGRAKVDASGVAVPITDNSGSLTVDDGGTTLSVDDGGASLTVDGSVTVSTVPAASRVTDSIAIAHQTDAIMSSLTALTPVFAPVTASASGVTTLVGAITSKRIRIVALFLVCAGAVTVNLQSHTTTATKTGSLPFAANGGICLPFNPVGWFQTESQEALDINLGGAVAVGGQIVYIAV